MESWATALSWNRRWRCHQYRCSSVQSSVHAIFFVFSTSRYVLTIISNFYFFWWLLMTIHILLILWQIFYQVSFRASWLVIDLSFKRACQVHIIRPRQRLQTAMPNPECEEFWCSYQSTKCPRKTVLIIILHFFTDSAVILIIDVTTSLK